ncbi:MAG: RNA methyltransferase [Solobacterium sp.]|nr:RNA methyltransferase [Solobacterium sp.]
METINSLQNKKVKEWASLQQKKYRDRTGRYLVEGKHLIEEALGAGCVETILYCADQPFAFQHTVCVTEAIMRKLSVNPSGAKYIAVCHTPVFLPKEENRVILLDGVQDPGNLGTIVRTAVSFGFDRICCSNECADLYNEKTIRSTQGALFRIPVERGSLEETIRNLKADGFTVVGTALRDSVAFSDLPEDGRYAFVLGNEGNGITEPVLELCDRKVRIEMDGFESLNVAVAGGIVMYRFRRKA